MRRSTGTISEDLIRDILLRLPSETVVELKLVCKSWLALILSPNFAKAHLTITAAEEKDVLHIIRTYVNGNKSTSVYSSNTNAWRKLGDNKPTDLPYKFGEFHVTVNTGLLCWATCYGIITFDLHTEVLTCNGINYTVPTFDGNMSNINNYNDMDSHALVTNFKDSIAVIIYKRSNYQPIYKLNLWALDNVECLRGGGIDASWTLIFNIDVNLPIDFVKGYLNSGDLLLDLYQNSWVPILRASEYPIWKVKMAMFLEATDPEYLDRIYDGPHKPTKLSVVVAYQPAKVIPKEKGDYTAKDISSIAKDARVRHLLHSTIDNVMSNRVIGCKTAKEIWDALETRCQGTDAIKKNRKTILTQEYEHFDSKSDVSLTDLYDRFAKLLNALSLVDKEYDLEDSNLKFLLALLENWDLKSTTIRDNYDLTETTLDEIYGMLKTHELNMDQRSKRHGRKSKTFALKAEDKAPKVVVSKRGNGKALIIKFDSESSNSDDDDSETESLSEVDVDAEMMQLCALMMKGIIKIAYKKFRKGKKFFRKGGSSEKKGFRKSEGKGGKSDRGDNSNVKCYNCGERGHISPDCKKGKSDKGQALITKNKNWAYTSDSEEEVYYALMANADSSSETAELKVPQTTLAFHTDDITELRLYLKTMFINFRDQTLTNKRLTSKNLALRNRNDYLEKELVFLHQIQKERDDSLYVKNELLKLNKSLKNELEKEREIIKIWTNSGRIY
ncbi:hypothetical protein AgCh_027157 [Apium graveolens]